MKLILINPKKMIYKNIGYYKSLTEKEIYNLARKYNVFYIGDLYQAKKIDKKQS